MPRSMYNRYDFTQGGSYDSLVYEFVYTDMETDEFEQRLDQLILWPTHGLLPVRQSLATMSAIVKSVWSN